MELMEGVEASSIGTTVATLDLKEGYYRTSAGSLAVLECYLEDACVGGIDVEDYCADGYKGPCEYVSSRCIAIPRLLSNGQDKELWMPANGHCLSLPVPSQNHACFKLFFDCADCAVCEDGYAPGTAYICRKCSGSSMGSAMGVAAAALAVTLLVVAVVASDLVRVVDGNGENSRNEERGARAALSRGFARCYTFSARAFPLTTVKIIVVVWQIITQVSAVLNVGGVISRLVEYTFDLEVACLHVGFGRSDTSMSIGDGAFI